MKKLLGIVVLGLLWCGIANAGDNKICDWVVNDAYPDILKEHPKDKKYFYVVKGDDGRCEYGYGQDKKSGFSDCEKHRKENGINGKCKLFAIGKKIILDKKDTKKLKKLKEAASYVSFDNLYDLGNIIKPTDPTSFKKIKYIGEEERNMVIGGWPIEKRRAYVFHAFYDYRSISDPLAKGTGVYVRSPDRGIQNIAKNKTKAEKECEARHCKEILVYYRKLKGSNLKKAKKIANQYAVALGQMPNILQHHLLDGIHIFGQPTSIKEIQNTNAQTWRKTIYIKQGWLHKKFFFEEVLMHELIHVFLGKVGEFSYDNLNKRIIKNDLTNEYNINLLDWKYAQSKDGAYITDYAKTSLAEDLAESFHFWFALRYKKISNKNKSKILKLIPNRIQFFDDQLFDMYPVAPYNAKK